MSIIKILLFGSCVSLVLNAWAETSADDNHKKIGASLNKKEEISVAELPAGVLQAIEELAPEMRINEAEKEYKHGNTYIDVEGTLEDGREIEFDLLKNDDQWQVVEIQRDLTLEQVPAQVLNVLKAETPTFRAKRIIESIQHGKDITIYEFYSVETNGEETRTEVKLENDKASLLDSEWSH